jgi:hypothetical protein
MNRLWVHTAELRQQGLFQDSLWTLEGMKKRLQTEYGIIAEFDKGASR